MAAITGRLTITYEHELSAADHAHMIASAVEVIRETNRVGNVQVMTDAAPTGVLLPGHVLHRMLEGFHSVGKNGESIHCTVHDPAEFRLASASAEPNLAFFGVSARRPDGVEELVAFLLGKRWERFREMDDRNLHGSWEWWVRDPRRAPGNDDQQFVKLLTLEPDGTHFYAPIWLHNQAVHGAVASAPVCVTASSLMALLSGIGEGRTVETEDQGVFTSADDPDVLAMLAKMRQARAREAHAWRETSETP